MTGHIVYAIGLPMALGQAAGAWVGTHTAMTHGERVIRPLLLLISFAVALRLLFDNGNHSAIGCECKAFFLGRNPIGSFSDGFRRPIISDRNAATMPVEPAMRKASR